MSITRVLGRYGNHRGHRRQRNRSLVTLRPFWAATSGRRGFGAPKPDLDKLVRRRIAVQRRPHGLKPNRRGGGIGVLPRIRTRSCGMPAIRRRRRHLDEPVRLITVMRCRTALSAQCRQVAPACRPVILRILRQFPSRRLQPDDDPRRTLRRLGPTQAPKSKGRDV